MILDWLAVVAARTVTLLASRPGPAVDSTVAALEADYPAPADLRDLRAGDDRTALLGRLLDLDPEELLVLLAAVAPELDANLGAGLALLAGGPAVGWVGVHAALEVAGVPTASGRVEQLLAPSSTLVRHGLLDIVGDGPRLHRRLRPAPRLVAHLAGDDEPDDALGVALLDVVPVDDDVVDEIGRALEAGAALVWLRGPATSARTEIAAAVFAQFDVAPLVVDLARVPPEDAETVARAAVREAVLTGCGLILAGLDEVARRRPGEDSAPAADPRAIANLLIRSVVPVLAVGDTPWQPSWSTPRPLAVEIGRTRVAEVRRLWAGELADLDGPELDSLLAVRLAPQGILDTVEYARLLSASRGRTLDAAAVRESARLVAAAGGGAGRIAARMGGTGERVGFDDLVLADAAIDDLRRMVGWVRVRHDVVSKSSVHGKAGKGTGIAALFTGGPGTGKTLAAHVVADELGLDLFQVDLTSVVDKYIGETERNLERVFGEAESRDVVLFFDEADSLFGKRSDVKDARDRYANQEVSYLLQRLEHFDGLTVLATNLRGNLDQAFTRRMQFLVHFADPDEPTRLRLWQRLLGNTGAHDESDAPDAEFLAGALEVSGGDIRNVVLGATYDAASAGESLGMRHLLVATRRELAKLGRQVPPALATG